MARKYREFSRETNKTDKLQGLSAYIGDFDDPLTAQGIIVDNNMLLLQLKVDFFTPSSDSWSQRFREMASYGLDNALAALPPDGAVTADGWLRAVLFSRIAADLEATPVERCDGARTAYIEAAQGVLHAIRESPSRGLLTSVSEDVESLFVLLNAGVGDGTFSASAAKAADEALRSPRSSILYDALKLTATCKE